MSINWYPGHMLKTKKEIIEDLNLVDVVLELLDARIPLSSQNPDIARIIGDKKHIVLLNKSDLAEETQNKKWIEYFNSNGNSYLSKISSIIFSPFWSCIYALYSPL